ncbi:MAG: aminoacyl-tRNA hydrolase [Hyphomicrobiaceae bacterium]|nr:aminoacyl-tRNA hydrolase [Hyphomicrobiaceae bacterium]
MKLIVGLGNPGGKYAQNRHNVGFMAVDELFEHHDFSPWRKRFSGVVAEGRIGRNKCLLLKPSTFMNESGRSVGEALRFYKLDLEDVFVLYDEIDLVPGKLKAKCSGGNAGHNGLRSMSAHVGNDYHRIRIGVGRPAQKSQVANHVLRDFSKADEEWRAPLLDAIARKFSTYLEQGTAQFLNEVAEHLAPLDEARPGKDRGRNKTGASQNKGKSAPAQQQGKQKSQKAAREDKSTTGDEGGPLADMLSIWKKSTKDK